MKHLKHFCIVCVVLCSVQVNYAVQTVPIADPETWKASDLSAYRDGDTVQFDVPMYIITNDYGVRATKPYNDISPRRPYTPDNRYPQNSKEYSDQDHRNYSGYVTLFGLKEDTLEGKPYRHRLGEKIKALTAVVKRDIDNHIYLEYVSGTCAENSRADLLKGIDLSQIDAKGKHTVLVCAANLEYYLASEANWGTGYGPENAAEHALQRLKVRQALALINADIYGFAEIEQGTVALREICQDLNQSLPDRHFVLIDNGTSPSAGSFTMTGFIYDDKKIATVGPCLEASATPRNRKYMQCFVENATGERFLFSMNHFKSMIDDGESTRIAEANAVNKLYNRMSTLDANVLIMGDLNSYAMNEPISILLQNGARTDLHRYFHADTSYSYTYYGDHYAAGYLDHAIADSTLLPQVTGMQAFHVNSDEWSGYAYYTTADSTMFRYSDHDPIVVGLRLSKESQPKLTIRNLDWNQSGLVVENGKGGFVRIYDMQQGTLLYNEPINDDYVNISPSALQSGWYVVHVFYNGQNHVTKYFRP